VAGLSVLCKAAKSHKKLDGNVSDSEREKWKSILQPKDGKGGSVYMRWNKPDWHLISNMLKGDHILMFEGPRT
jgi:hypothetical protein